jgi:hypothetical protein
MERSAAPRSLYRSLVRIVAWAFAGLAVAVLAFLAALFLYNSNLPWAPARTALTAVFALLVPALFVLLKPRRKALVAFALVYGLIALWFALIPASNDRDWQPDVARTARAHIDGDRVTVENVRNFRYRSIDDYDIAWDTRTYDLSQLRTVDISFSYWGSKAIAHTMLSFGFAGGDHLCLSIEPRKETHEQYAPIGSFFKMFEIIYILGDERDLMALRTNFRGDDTYLFPSSWPPEKVRALLLDILDRVNSLADRPEHYRTVRDNCMTSLLTHIDRVRGERIPFSFKLLFNGYTPQLAYERGDLPADVPFAEVMQRYAINAKARAAPVDAGYSARIRHGLGEPSPSP